MGAKLEDGLSATKFGSVACENLKGRVECGEALKGWVACDGALKGRVECDTLGWVECDEVLKGRVRSLEGLG